VAGLAASFGSGAMTSSIAEIKNTECIFIIGSNTSENHPVIALEVMEAVRKNGARLIVADPRHIRMVDFAHLWLRHRPGTDIALINGLLNIIIQENLCDAEFINSRTEGFEAVKQAVAGYTPGVVSRITGVKEDDLKDAARIYAGAGKAMILFAMGITQHTSGTDNVMALANLAMATGHVGKEGSGVCPLRGQNNVQGACDMGALPNVYTGYQPVTDMAAREKFEQAWGVKLEGTAGLTLVEMMHAAQAGKVRAMYIMGEEPALTDPDSCHVEAALKKLDFLAVQNIFMGETGKYADVILPGTSFAEKDGTFTNTERRVQRVRRAIDPVGDSRPDWVIISLISTRMGYEMKYDHPSDIMSEIASLTPTYAGINYSRLEQGGLQWPCRSASDPGTRYLHANAFTRGKGRFAVTEYSKAVELPDDDYPMIFTTGRNLYHWHGGTMSRQSPGLEEICPEGLAEIHPQDAENLGLDDGDIVELASRRGKIKARISVTEKSPPGVVFMPFHFKESPANRLTLDALDPVARIPELKVCAVNISRADNLDSGACCT